MNLPASPETLFEGALRCQTAEERLAYLDQVCAGRPELRLELERLLEAHDCSGGFLEVAPEAIGTAIQRNQAYEETPGTVIDRYKLVARIGEGGMGMVYEAEQTEPIMRRVALKIIKLGMDTRQVVARFEAERQALALMDHPNIAKVLDGGATQSGRPYFVMELVKGVPITEYCDRKRLSTKERLELFIPVCLAIQHAHQKGIIHRDIKPSNVMVRTDRSAESGVPQVIDFGVAKATHLRLTEKTLFTNDATMIGTPAYMSPEQADMSGVDVDTRTDVYSLGVLLYELLTGTTPLNGKELLGRGYAAMQRILTEEEPPKPSTRVSTLAHDEKAVVANNRRTDAPALCRVLQGDLDCIVIKCLEKDRTRRYETANGLAMDIRRFLRDEPLVARPPSSVYRIQKMARRHKLAFVSGTIVAAAVCLALAGLSVATVRITREKNRKEAALWERQIAMETARQREQEATEQLAKSLGNEARSHRYSRRIGQRFEALADIASSVRIRPGEWLTDDAIAAMALPDIRKGPSWVWPFPNAEFSDFDDLYRRYAYIDDKGHIVVGTIPDNKEIQRIDADPARPITGLHLSPDGESVVRLERDRRLRVWRVADGSPIFSQAPTNCWGVAFSHDHRQMAFCRSNWVHLIELASGREVNRWPIAGTGHWLSFAPNDKHLAVGYMEAEETSVYDSTDGSLVANLPVGPMQLQVVAWHPDGNRLAIAGSDPRIQIWNLQTRGQIARLEGHTQHVTMLTFHPNGDLLGSRSWDGILRLWDPWRGAEWLRVPLDASIRFSSDGKWFGASPPGSGECQLWEVAANPEYRSLGSSFSIDRAGYYEGDISADGRWLVLGMQDGVRIWEISTGREAAFLPIGPSLISIFRNCGSELITASATTGLLRWELEATNPAQIYLGPPVAVPLPSLPPALLSLAADGSTLAVLSEKRGEAAVLDVTREPRTVCRVAHPSSTDIILSPDGRWMVTSGWHSEAVRLWDAASGQLTHEWRDSRQSRVFFTPDSRELVISRGVGFTFWDVATRRLTRQLRREVPLHPGWVAFSGEGNLMAMETSPGVVDLREVATTRTVARLEDPFGDQSFWIAFTPGNKQLVTVAPYSRAIHIWNLAAIRENLTGLGLSANWTTPEDSPRPGGRQPAHALPPVKIEVLGAETLTNAPASDSPN